MAASASSPAASAASTGSGGSDPPLAAAAAPTAGASACPCPICLESFKDEAYLDTCFQITSNISGVQRYWEQKGYLRKKNWLETWIRREIQALTRDENVEAIVYHIHGVIGSFMKRLEKEHTSRRISPEKRREEFRTLLSDAARPFLLGRTERFVTEAARLGRSSEASTEAEESEKGKKRARNSNLLPRLPSPPSPSPASSSLSATRI
ncbi:hypothetical protein C2845_PM01G22610 [Panicum miliaceum]|uniref:Uncharacterized protein n=1 Tax=Panicum miliaceum TaxID=4540 RepID=A0A3L6TLB1_PANMI|nr:hypothetical protein C2845_PM01G22610 [Panicum miliaceum]